MKKKLGKLIGDFTGTMIGLSMAPAIGNASEAAAANPNMGAGGSALIRTTPTLYSAKLTGGLLNKKYKW